MLVEKNGFDKFCQVCDPDAQNTFPLVLHYSIQQQFRWFLPWLPFSTTLGPFSLQRLSWSKNDGWGLEEKERDHRLSWGGVVHTGLLGKCFKQLLKAKSVKFVMKYLWKRPWDQGNKRMTSLYYKWFTTLLTVILTLTSNNSILFL